MLIMVAFMLIFSSVKSIKPAQVNVSLRNAKLHGRIYISEIWDEIKEVKSL